MNTAPIFSHCPDCARAETDPQPGDHDRSGPGNGCLADGPSDGCAAVWIYPKENLDDVA